MSEGDLVASASAYLDAHRPAEARRLIGSHLARYPDDTHAYCLLAQTLLALDERLGAREAAARAIDLDPNSEWAWRLLSRAESAVGSYRAARRSAETARELAPQIWQTHVNLALIDVAAKQVTKDTHDSVRRAYVLAPNSPSVHLAAGNVALAANNLKEAKRAYGAVLAVNPMNEDARNNLAVIDLKHNRVGSAAAAFMELLSDDPNYALALRNFRAASRQVLAVLNLLLTVGSLSIWMYCAYKSSFSTPAAFASGLKPVILGVLVCQLTFAAVFVFRFRARNCGRFRQFLLSVRATDPSAMPWAIMLTLGLLMTALLLALPTDAVVAFCGLLALPPVAAAVASRVAR